MQRRHAENPLPGKLERRHLQHHRQRLDHKHAAHDEQHDLLPHDDGNGAECGAQRECPDIAHKHFRRISVEPQKSQARARDRATEHGEFAGAGDVRETEIFRKHRIAGNVGEYSKGAADHHGRHDCQPVQSVGQIDRIAGADNHEIGHDDEADRAERVRHILEKRHNEFGLGRQIGGKRDIAGGRNPDHRLPEELGARRQSLGITIDDFSVVVHPADRAETQGHPKHDPYQAVLQIRPQQGGEDYRDQNQRAAHGRRAGLGQMRLGAVIAHRLPDLVRGQPSDHARPDDESDDQRSKAGQHRTQRDVIEHVECTNVLGQPLGEF